MKTRDQFAVFPQRQYRSGLLLLIVAAYVRLLVSIPFDPPRVAILVGLGLLYTMVGLIGLEYCWRSPSRPIVLAYFIVLVVVLVAVSLPQPGRRLPSARAPCRLQYCPPPPARCGRHVRAAAAVARLRGLVCR